MTRIINITLDDANLPPPTPEIDQERQVAVFDLLERNVFIVNTLIGRSGALALFPPLVSFVGIWYTIALSRTMFMAFPVKTMRDPLRGIVAIVHGLSRGISVAMY